MTLCDSALLSVTLCRQSDGGSDLGREVEILSVYLADTLVRAILSVDPTPLRTGGGQCGRLVAALATLLRLMTTAHYCHLWVEMADDDQLAQFLVRLMPLFRELISEPVRRQATPVTRLAGDVRDS